MIKKRQKDQEELEEGQEEQYNDERPHRKFVEDEFSDSDVE